MHNNIYSYLGILPKISNKVFIAPSANIIGDVTIGEGSSVWFNTVIRGDVAPIVIGSYSNIQDGSVIHVTRNGGKTTIGSYVTVGHSCILHACLLEDYSFVGMGSLLLDDAKIETHGYLAAGSLLTSGKIVKTGQMWAGRPAKYFRDLTQAEIDYISKSAMNYYKHNEEYTSRTPNDSI